MRKRQPGDNGKQSLESITSTFRMSLSLVNLNFREEIHAIEAAVSGQGIAICSDLLVAPELASGALVKLTNVTMPGCTFFIVHRDRHPKMASIKAFLAWAMEAR